MNSNIKKLEPTNPANKGGVKTASNRGGVLLEARKQANFGKQVRSKTIQKEEAKKPTSQYHGYAIVGKASDPEKWRCKVCKFMNENANESCSTCREPKSVFDERSIKMTNQNAIPPRDFSKKEEKKKAPRRAGSVEQSKPKVMTLGDIKTEQQVNMASGKQPRYHKETSMQLLQKIAKNTDNVMPCMKTVQDKDLVKATRTPAQFNAMTFAREYGGVPE